MRSTAALLTCCAFFLPQASADELLNADDMPYSVLGGIMIFRQGDQRGIAVGGAMFPRRIRTSTITPDGKVVTRYILPSNFQGPPTPFLNRLQPAHLHVELPDANWLLYIDGHLLPDQGAVRELKSSPLEAGKVYTFHLHAACKVGANVLLEEREVLVRPGERTVVTFDGTRAAPVSLPRSQAAAMSTR